MRSKVLRYATASLLSTVLLVPFGVQPARAAVEWAAVIEAGIKVVGTLAELVQHQRRDFGGHPSDPA